VGYYDKLDGVLAQALSAQNSFKRDAIEVIAREHQMCPFELSLDLSYWVDCLICDYNYVFDPTVYLRRFFDDPGEEYCFLIDEAHNLVDRGRDMFSAEIEKSSVMKLKRKLAGLKGSGTTEIVRKLEAVNRAFLKLRKEHIESLDEDHHAVSNDLPKGLLTTLRGFRDVAEIWLATHDRSANSYEELLQFYFDALRLIRFSEMFDDNYVCLVKRFSKNNLFVQLYCVDPSRLLRDGLERGRSALFFSATLTPIDYFRKLLGVDEGSRFVNLPSPFPREHLGVYVVRDIATNYRQRAASYDRIVAVVDTITGGHAGNYLVYFPSYKYMEEIQQRFAAEHPDVTTIMQSRGMEEEDRQAFLDQFDADNAEVLVGFAVMGGIFGEGIDLKGRRLVGVVIVGVGLPQLGIERDLIRDHFSGASATDEDQGFEYAYQYPGMNRVLQTAGRVIRSERDKGIICLIDDRFAQQRYRRLFPSHWAPLVIRQAALQEEVGQFWKAVEASDSEPADGR
jgi:Rad3-related DNA helicase